MHCKYFFSPSQSLSQLRSGLKFRAVAACFLGLIRDLGVSMAEINPYSCICI